MEGVSSEGLSDFNKEVAVLVTTQLYSEELHL